MTDGSVNFAICLYNTVKKKLFAHDLPIAESNRSKHLNPARAEISIRNESNLYCINQRLFNEEAGRNMQMLSQAEKQARIDLGWRESQNN